MNASSAPTTSSRSTPRSSAKWFRVPPARRRTGSPLRGDRGDDRLGAIPAGHANRVRAVVDRAFDERHEVLAEVQLDRLDAASAGLTRDVEALGLAPA